MNVRRLFVTGTSKDRQDMVRRIAEQGARNLAEPLEPIDWKRVAERLGYQIVLLGHHHLTARQCMEMFRVVGTPEALACADLIEDQIAQYEARNA